jgi:hypothetical protein
MLPVSLDCPFLIAPSVFANVYLFCLSLSCVKEQSRMDNPEKMEHWVHKKQDKDKQNK